VKAKGLGYNEDILKHLNKEEALAI